MWGILVEFVHFSAGFKHSPSIYTHFDFRNMVFMVFLAVTTFGITKNQMVAFRKLYGLEGCQIVRYFSWIQLI